ncbi:hypothetical protein IKE83_02940 [Candidatus Saccharibacteria bacterium]|nr:hypothetical protein [Candidatus Saccharibacteria bacterium]
MEKIGDMLSSRMLEVVTSSFKNVTGNTILKSLGTIGNSQVYEEVGAPYEWRLEFDKSHTIIGVHRNRVPT